MGIRSLAITHDNSKQFCGSYSGKLGKIELKTKNKDKILVDYGKFHESDINDIAITHDDLYLFTVSDDRNLIQFSIKDEKILKRYGPILNSDGLRIQIPSNDNCLIIGTSEGLVLFVRSILNNKKHSQKNIGNEVYYFREYKKFTLIRELWAIKVTADEKFAICIDFDGKVNLQNLEEKTLKKNGVAILQNATNVV